MSKKALLMILDGWGIGDQGKDDVIFNTPTPYWDYLVKTYPHSQLQASGENVGLPDGQMGNSEVGHLNIGAGRVVYQDLVKINLACRDNSIMKNPEIVSAFTYAKENGKNIHFMGLTSDGGVHSSLDHLFKLCDISKEYGIENTYVHCFMDGRDTDPKSGKGFIAGIDGYLFDTPTDHVYNVTVCTDNSVCVIYINDNVAYTNRIYGVQQNTWSVNCYSGTVEVSNLKISYY